MGLPPHPYLSGTSHPAPAPSYTPPTNNTSSFSLPVPTAPSWKVPFGITSFSPSGRQLSSGFSLVDLQRATRGFHPDMLLARGGFSLVYRGQLPNGTEIAVKVLTGSRKLPQLLAGFSGEAVSSDGGMEWFGRVESAWSDNVGGGGGGGDMVRGGSEGVRGSEGARGGEQVRMGDARSVITASQSGPLLSNSADARPTAVAAPVAVTATTPGTSAAGSGLAYSYSSTSTVTDKQPGLSGPSAVPAADGVDSVYSSGEVASADPAQAQLDRQFLNEASLLSCLNHKNVVKLLGTCHEAGVRALVFRYESCGSLQSVLHGDRRPGSTAAGQAGGAPAGGLASSGNAKRGAEGENMAKSSISDGVDTKPGQALDWQSRLKIALGAAQGLKYLHEDAHPHVIHGDFKSANILLSSDLVPRVSDLGHARKVTSTGADPHHQPVPVSNLLGTFGYVAPELALTGHVLTKSDVYSYGVVLLELITGRRSVSYSDQRDPESLVKWALPLLSRPEGLSTLVDEKLQGNYPPAALARVAEIARACLQDRAEDRPFMGEVVLALKPLIPGSGEKGVWRRIGKSQSHDPGAGDNHKGERWRGNEGGLKSGNDSYVNMLPYSSSSSSSSGMLAFHAGRPMPPSNDDARTEEAARSPVPEGLTAGIADMQSAELAEVPRLLRMKVQGLDYR